MGSVVESIGNAIDDAVNDVGGFLGGDIIDDALGLDSLGKEVERWADDLGQVVQVITGNYHTDMKVLNQKQAELDRFQSNYQSELDVMIDKTNSLIAFHEIFKLAMANRIDEYTTEMDGELEKLIAEYQALVNSIQSEYDFVIGMTQGDFLGPLGQIVGSLIMIVGGIMSDMGDILSGDADSGTWTRIVISIIAIVVIVLLVMAMMAGMPTQQLIAATLAIVSSLLTLDSMYANGSLMGAIMSMLDFALNDVLQMDQWAGSDFAKFDSDHEDYAEMAMYIQTGIALAAIATSWASGLGNVMVEAAGTTLGLSAAAIASAGPYMKLYAVYNIASTVNDVVGMNEAYEDLKAKFAQDQAALNNRVETLRRKNFMKHYKDTAAFLTDQQDVIDSYVWSITASNMYVDPYATTPVASIRFSPDDDVRGLSYGFENLFNYNNMAGGSNYIKSILYEMGPSQS